MIKHQKNFIIRHTVERRPVSPRPGLFLVSILVVFIFLISLSLTLLCSYQNIKNIFMIAKDGDASWYLDYAGRRVPEIIDQELFYHNIGDSIEYVQSSDIVLLGPSFISYAFDQVTLKKQLEDPCHVKVYNMSFLGIRGGEFSRQIAERWEIRPKLWIINVDDQFIHFFGPSLDMSFPPHPTVIPAIGHSRVVGMLRVATTNLRWRFEEFFYGNGPPGLTHGIYRNARTGQLDLTGSSKFLALDNPHLVISRDQDCHVKPETIITGRNFIKSLGGRVILTLVPHSQYCPAQALELSRALGVEIILSPKTGYSMVDGGGHMDHMGAVDFTTFFVGALKQTKTFQEMLAAKQD